MKILLLYGESPGTNGVDLAEAAKKQNHSITMGSIREVSSNISSSCSRFWLKNEEVTNFDLCFIRSFGPGTCEQLTRRISMMEHMEFSGIKVVNPTYSFRRARDKYSSQYSLAKSGLPIAETFTTEDMEKAYQKSKELKVSVYKPILGSMGKGSLKFDNPDMAFNAWKMLNRLGQPLIVQEFIKNPGRDIRVFVIGENVVGSAYRYHMTGQWKANVAQGGKMVDEPICTDIIEMGVKATKALGLIYAGVDIIESVRGPIVLEVNGSPGWQALKRTAGIDVAKKIVEYAAQLIRK